MTQTKQAPEIFQRRIDELDLAGLPARSSPEFDTALAIRMTADMLDADFVFVIMEAWSLRKDKMPQMDAILDKYGSIGASPYRVDVVSFGLETRYGVWMSQCEIKPKGISKKKRTIGTPTFQYFKEVAGRFTHLLKKNPEEEGGATLH